MYIFISVFCSIALSIIAGAVVYKDDIKRISHLKELKRKIKNGEMDNEMTNYIVKKVDSLDDRVQDLELKNQERFNKLERHVDSSIAKLKTNLLDELKNEVVSIIESKTSQNQVNKYRWLKTAAVSIVIFGATMGSNIFVGHMVFKLQQKEKAKIETLKGN